MASRAKLRVVRGTCPKSLRPGVERAMETCLRAIGLELQTLTKSAEEELGDEELATLIANASANVQLARLELERRKAGAG